MAVVIVNFCQWRNTVRLVRQLRRSVAHRAREVEIVVVDNASAHEDCSERLARIDGTRLETNSTNIGFAAAVNRGANAIASEWVLLLNPDVTVDEGFLDDALTAWEKAIAVDPTTGVIGFQLRDTDGATQPSCGQYPTFFSTLKGLMLPRSRRKCQRQSLDHRRKVDWVTGGCLLVRRDCLQSLGGFDEQFFLYYEDVDFCQRARAAGWSIWYDPSLSVTHHWPLHKRSVPAPLRLITRHALLTYATKYWRRWQVNGLCRVMRCEAVVRGLFARCRGDKTSVSCYRELGRMARDNSSATAADAIAFAAQFLRPIASAQDAGHAAS